MTRLGCLFCGRPIDPGEPCCSAFERAGVAAHQRCCGCQGWASWTRPGQALPPPAEWWRIRQRRSLSIGGTLDADRDQGWP